MKSSYLLKNIILLTGIFSISGCGVITFKDANQSGMTPMTEVQEYKDRQKQADEELEELDKTLAGFKGISLEEYKKLHPKNDKPKKKRLEIKDLIN